MLKRIDLTLFAIASSLFPPVAGRNGGSAIAPDYSNFPISTRVLHTKEEIGYYLADLHRGVDPDGGLALQFCGCFAVAAPFLLYRLKKSGFSGCRVSMNNEGLLLSAHR